jgi:hypothetical protein
LGNWYSAVVINAIHFFANILAYYEYCNLGYILDIVKGFAAIDIVFLTDYVLRVGLGSFLLIPDLLEKFKSAVQGDYPDYMAGGQYIGEIVTLMTQVVTNS